MWMRPLGERTVLKASPFVGEGGSAMSGFRDHAWPSDTDFETNTNAN